MEKLLIGSLELSAAKSSGKPLVELYSTNTALQFPELRLFDLSALAAIGIDPNTLVQGERIHRRFWAYYTVSDKTNSHGNNYRDVQHLEAIDTPATATSVDTSALLRELREMRDLLTVIAAAVDADPHRPRPEDAPDDPVQRAIVEATTGSPPPETAASIQALPHRERYRYSNGLACSANERERQAFDAYVTAEEARPTDVDMLREWIQNTPKPREG